MTRAELDPFAVKRAVMTARFVKPVTGDFTLSLSGGVLRVWSYDRRKSSLGVAKIVSGSVDCDDEFFLPADRAALFDSDLSSLSVSVTDKGLVLRFDGDGRSRTATVKRRADSSRRMRIPPAPDFSSYDRIDATLFDSLLRQVSCSALVKETKTDEEMKWNQIHFYPAGGYVTSNARYYASVARMDGLGLDFSMVSCDIPVVRSFCSKSSGVVLVGSDSRAVRIHDPASGSWMSFAKVSCDRPVLSVPDGDGTTSASFKREDFHKSVKWCVMALDGTMRTTMSVSDGCIRFLSGSSEVSVFPADITGGGFTTDLPVKVLSTISDHMLDGDMRMVYGNRSIPEVVEITQGAGPVSSRHFVKGMRPR